MQKFTTNLETHITQLLINCQEKRTENLFNPVLSEFSIKKTLKLQAELKAKNLFNKLSLLTSKHISLLNTFFSMFNRYKAKKITPSHKWLSSAVGCCRNTVITATNKLRDCNLVNKKSRGWDVVNLETNTFKSKTCDYSLDGNLLEDFKFITKHLPKSHVLCQRIMALVPLFITFWALTSLNLNYKVNITSNKSIRSNSMTFFGEYNYEISKISKNLTQEPTTTLPVEHLDSIFTQEHPGNIQEVNDYNTLKEIDSVNDWFEDTQKRKCVDLRFCIEHEYKILSKKEKIIAHAFFNGKKTFNSLQKYQDKLIRLNANNLQTLYLKWILQKGFRYNKLPVELEASPGDSMIEKLNQSQLEKIQSFGEEILIQVRTDIKNSFNKTITYQWVINRCMHYKNKYFSASKQIQAEKEQLEYERSKYPFREYKPEPKKENKIIQNDSPKINEDFIKLIGEENFLAYAKRCKFI